MKQFRKRTIALVLASVVSVAGSFASENYKNSIMAINFSTSQNGTVEMVLQTKSAYSGSVTPIRKDANTYVLMLPEINSQAATPELQGGIESVNIRTMPYTTGGKGYTKITIKANSSTVLNTTAKIFIPSSQPTNTIATKKEASEVIPQQATKPTYASRQTESNKETSRKSTTAQTDNKNYYNKTTDNISQHSESSTIKDDTISLETETVSNDISTENNPEHTTEKILLILGALLIITCIIYFYTKAKNKLTEIAGESLNIDIEDEKTPSKKQKKESKREKIKTTIKKLDSKYPHSAVISRQSNLNNENKKQPQSFKKEEMNVVDLDELFQEQVKSQNTEKYNEEDEDENKALEDFLSGFFFDEESIEEEPQEAYDTAFFEALLKTENLKFSKNDVECINKLLKIEINDTTLKDIKNFAVSNPIKASTAQDILEDLVTTYTISHNISFNKEDINALYKIITVEIEPDFVTDLRTNPKRTKEMENEIINSSERLKKPSEIVTLSVRGMLPNLSEALKKQGNRRIVSDYKPTVIDYHDSCEVRKFSVDTELPDLSVEINNKSAYRFKPTEEIQYTDDSYEVVTLSTSNQLPDLQDALTNPSKYEKEEKKIIVDEDALLQNISNVQFKPFYDDSTDIEILNKVENAPSVSDIQKELSQFANFEITEDESPVIIQTQEEYDDFTALYSNNFVDLDKPNNPKESNNNIITKTNNQESTTNKKFETENFEPVNLERKIKFAKREPRQQENTKSLMEKIKASREERLLQKEGKQISPQTTKQTDNNSIPKETPKDIKCILEGEAFSVVSSVALNEKIGCHLAKNENGYAILGYNENKLYKIKEYKTLKSEKIQARLTEKLPNNTIRYIVRIGLNKLIVDIKDNNLEYVMDLC